jgi:hypothetical protein
MNPWLSTTLPVCMIADAAAAFGNVDQPLYDQSGRRLRTRDLDWEISRTKKIGQNVLRGQLAHASLCSPCHAV